jgi:hypothetical protein
MESARGGDETDEWREEARKMRFEEAYGDWQARRLTQELLPSASKIGHAEFVPNPHFTWPGNGSDLFIIGVRWE